jgi:hypothetical protein
MENHPSREGLSKITEKTSWAFGCIIISAALFSEPGS